MILSNYPFLGGIELQINSSNLVFVRNNKYNASRIDIDFLNFILLSRYFARLLLCKYAY